MSRLESLRSDLFQPLAEDDAAALKGGMAQLTYLGKSYDIQPDGTRITDDDWISDADAATVAAS